MEYDLLLEKMKKKLDIVSRFGNQTLSPDLIDIRIITKNQNRYKETILSIAIDALDVADKSKCVLIGDRDQDVIGASKNGIDCIYVLYGYGNRDEAERCGAKIICETIENLHKTLLD